MVRYKPTDTSPRFLAVVTCPRDRAQDDPQHKVRQSVKPFWFGCRKS